MPKGVYKRTKEHINNLRPSLIKNFKKLERCGKCGLFLGKKAHRCIGIEEKREGAKKNFNAETLRKAGKTLKRRYKCGEIIPYWKGKKRDKRTIEKIRETRLKNPIRYNVGRKASEESKRKMSKSHIGINVGKDHYNWKGGVTNKVKKRWCSVEYQRWRKLVFERDDYICQKCGKRNEKGVGVTIKLNAHHIKSIYNYPELIFDVDNGETLCVSCHLEYHKKYGFKNENENKKR